jgi:peptide-methionine (S)-S-oxide reductase
MQRFVVRSAVALAVTLPLAAIARRSDSHPVSIPAPTTTTDATMGPRSLQTIVLAGGCFWGVEAVYEHLKGVTEAVSGYAGGTKATADYETVSTGSTGHAESVRVTFDPAKVSLEQILQVFFSVVHDPTQLNRQGPDVGPQYRSVIFYTSEEQARVARAYIDQLTEAKVFARPIVTQVVKLDAFYPAEAYHQDFAARNPTYPYIVFHVKPKVENLKKQFPELYR